MLASRLAREHGFDEALLVTPHGRVLEAPTSSIFWVKDGEVLTPPLDDHILASITRALVIELTGASERACTLEDLSGADEAFLASTIARGPAGRRGRSSTTFDGCRPDHDARRPAALERADPSRSCAAG